MATYVWVDDELKVRQAQGIRFPKRQKHPKATLAELLTLAIFHGVFSLREKQPAPGPGPRQWTGIARSLAKPHPRPGHAGTQARLLQSLAGCKVYAQSLLSLPPPPQDVPLQGSSSRLDRVLQKAQGLLAHLAVRVFWGKGLRKLRASPVNPVVDLKPLPLAHGQRIHGLHLPDAAVGVGPVGAFGGYVLLPVMSERGLFWNLAPSGLTRWALLPGRPGVGKVVETGWMGRVRNWIETRFRGMVRSLGLHRIEARSYWGLVARVNLILLVHNLIRSRVLLKMAGWSHKVAREEI